MSLPKVNSNTTVSGSMDLYRIPSSTVSEIGSHPVSEYPSEVTFVFDRPSEETSIQFHIQPNLGKMTAKCFKTGARTVMIGKCETSKRKIASIGTLYGRHSQAFSRASSMSTKQGNSEKVENPASEARSKSGSRTLLSGSNENIRSRGSKTHSVLIEDNLEKLENKIPNTNPIYSESSIWSNESPGSERNESPNVDTVSLDRSVLAEEASPPIKKSISCDSSGSISESPNSIGNATSNAIDSAQQQPISDKGSPEKVDNFTPSVTEPAGNQFSAFGEETPNFAKVLENFPKEGQVHNATKDSPKTLENLVRNVNYVQINNEVSGELAKLMIHVMQGKEGMILYLSKEEEEEIATLELDTESNYFLGWDEVDAGIESLAADVSKLSSAASERERNISETMPKEDCAAKITSESMSGISKTHSSQPSHEVKVESNCDHELLSSFGEANSSRVNDWLPKTSLLPNRFSESISFSGTENKSSKRSMKSKTLLKKTVDEKSHIAPKKHSAKNEEIVECAENMSFIAKLKKIETCIDGILREWKEIETMPEETIEEQYRLSLNKFVEVANEIDIEHLEENLMKDIGVHLSVNLTISDESLPSLMSASTDTTCVIYSKASFMTESSTAISSEKINLSHFSGSES